MLKRRALHQRAQAALAHLAAHYERRNDLTKAREIELDPWREEAHAQLMRVRARQGPRSKARTPAEGVRQSAFWEAMRHAEEDLREMC